MISLMTKMITIIAITIILVTAGTAVILVTLAIDVLAIDALAIILGEGSSYLDEEGDTPPLHFYIRPSMYNILSFTSKILCIQLPNL